MGSQPSPAEAVLAPPGSSLDQNSVLLQTYRHSALSRHFVFQGYPQFLVLRTLMKPVS